MKVTLLAVLLLLCRESLTESLYNREMQNRFSRGVQTFDSAEATDESTTQAAQDMPTTLKPLPSTYTVVDWKRFYPFGDKIPDANATNATVQITQQPAKSASPAENQLVYPVYVRVPIRVPLKSYTPKIVMPRTIRGAKSVTYPYRYKVPPRYMMVKQMPMRRKYVAYYTKPQFKRYYKYVKPVYQKTGLHDYYKKSVYYPIRGQGYEVTEPKFESPNVWYDPETRKLVTASD